MGFSSTLKRDDYIEVTDLNGVVLLHISIGKCQGKPFVRCDNPTGEHRVKLRAVKGKRMPGRIQSTRRAS